MIFIMVGTHFQGFDRLVEKADELAGRIQEEIVIQLGHTRYEPKNARYFRFIERDEDIKELMKKARIVICQGAMSVIDALEMGTPVVAVPRLQRYGEHMNDHQLIFSRKIEETGYIRVVEDIEDLASALLFKPVKQLHVERNREIISFLKAYIAS